MKILYLPAYFFPEQAASSYINNNRNQAFADAGFDTIVYVPTPCRGVDQDVRKKYCSKQYRKELMYNGKMTVHRFPLYAEGKNPILRALRYTLCWIKQFNRGLFAKDIDCIYLASTPPIQGVLGGMLKKLKKVPFVYNLQDIFPDSLVGTGLAKKDGLLWKIGRRIENFTYRNADKIIVISQDFKRNIMAKGVPEEKIEVVYNWVDENAITPVMKKMSFLRSSASAWTSSEWCMLAIWAMHRTSRLSLMLHVGLKTIKRLSLSSLAKVVWKTKSRPPRPRSNWTI